MKVYHAIPRMMSINGRGMHFLFGECVFDIGNKDVGAPACTSMRVVWQKRYQQLRRKLHAGCRDPILQMDDTLSAGKNRERRVLGARYHFQLCAYQEI